MLEVAIGPGYLLGRYADRFEAVGVDFNRRMLETARATLATGGISAPLVRADAVRLPFRDASFDCVVNTMALSGFPRATAAVAEFRRVLRRDGRLVLLDVAYPRDGNALGMGLAELWKLTGDLVRDSGALLAAAGFRVEEREVGGFGSVHLYLSTPDNGGVRPVPTATPQAGAAERGQDGSGSCPADQLAGNGVEDVFRIAFDQPAVAQEDALERPFQNAIERRLRSAGIVGIELELRGRGRALGYTEERSEDPAGPRRGALVEVLDQVSDQQSARVPVQEERFGEEDVPPRQRLVEFVRPAGIRLFAKHRIEAKRRPPFRKARAERAVRLPGRPRATGVESLVVDLVRRDEERDAP